MGRLQGTGSGTPGRLDHRPGSLCPSLERTPTGHLLSGRDRAHRVCAGQSGQLSLAPRSRHEARAHGKQRDDRQLQRTHTTLRGRRPERPPLAPAASLTDCPAPPAHPIRTSSWYPTAAAMPLPAAVAVNASVLGPAPSGLGQYARGLIRSLDTLREGLVVYTSYPDGLAGLRATV